jgi:hypothetical protein
MRQFSAALLGSALGTARALFAPPRVHRSASAAGRRHRSTRVRRYVSTPVPASTPPGEAVPAGPVALDRPGHPRAGRTRHGSDRPVPLPAHPPTDTPFD